MELLEIIFLILAPILFVAALVNGFIMQYRMRKLRRMLMASGRCGRCLGQLDSAGICPACSAKK
jgi:hypothetical protein